MSRLRTQLSQTTKQISRFQQQHTQHEHGAKRGTGGCWGGGEEAQVLPVYCVLCTVYCVLCTVPRYSLCLMYEPEDEKHFTDQVYTSHNGVRLER